MNRVLSREDLSRTLVMYGAFTASALILDGDDEIALAHLRRLRARLDDERGEAVERVTRGLESIMACERLAPESKNRKPPTAGRKASRHPG
jgi:hypothetical protein